MRIGPSIRGLSGRLAARVRIATFASRLLIGTCAIAVAACAAEMRDVVPQQLTDKAQVVGLESRPIRMWGDETPTNLAKGIAELENQRRATRSQGTTRSADAESILVISGGGSDGAFGAGLLSGWTAARTRPIFGIVTGVSTGALMAPFAFLGPRYDALLKEFYTQYSTDDILRPTIIAGLFGGSALTSSEPLANLIAKYVDRKLLAEIAAEHKKGRRLLIGTTNIDAERPVIWNMGEIASAGSDRSLALFRKVLLASASIPGVFPPVLINVEAGGKVRQEMHVDGGTTDNAVLLPISTNLKAIDRQLRIRTRRRLYIIVNSHLNPEWKQVKPSTIDIASRSIITLIKQQTLADVQKLYVFANENDLDYYLATVPEDFAEKPKEAFDKKYMTDLFKLGRRLGNAGYKWKRKPPNR
jgi:predicted acylesterase/phospholipase RssA